MPAVIEASLADRATTRERAARRARPARVQPGREREGRSRLPREPRDDPIGRPCRLRRPSKSARPGRWLRPPYRWRFAHLAALWGVRRESAGVLDAEGESRVPRRAWLDTRGRRRLRACSSPSSRRCSSWLVEAIVAPVWKLLSRALHSVADLGLRVPRLPPARAAARARAGRRAAAADESRPSSILIAYMRWEAFRSVLSFSLLLPVLGALFFVATVPLAVDDRAGADVEVRTADAGRDGLARRAADELAPARRRIARRGAVPGLRTDRARRRLVPRTPRRCTSSRRRRYRRS